ncbi:MAG TPA: hypothetical protein PLV92_22045 [Pirellulaceae bacterium]|nr:hypothetical protein [Pirellulaceae bacterium]
MADKAPDEALADGLKKARMTDCHFALLIKPPQPVKLIVQKKPILDGPINEAKKEKKATEIVRGVLRFDGGEFVFIVTGDPPVEEPKLKKFVETEASMTAKVRFFVVSELPTVSESDVSLVKLGKARIEWLPVRDKAIADIRALKVVIGSEFANDADQKPQLAAALKTLDQIIADIGLNLHEQLDAILSADQSARVALISKAKTTIDGFRTKLDRDPIMVELDDNEFVPGMQVVGPLKSILRDITVALG